MSARKKRFSRDISRPIVATLGTQDIVLSRIGRIFFAEYVGSAFRISLTLPTSSRVYDGSRFFLGAVGMSSSVDRLRLSNLLFQRWKYDLCRPKCRQVSTAFGLPSPENFGDSLRCQSSTLRRNLAFGDGSRVSGLVSSLWRGNTVTMFVGHPMRPFMAAPSANELCFTHSSRSRVSYLFLSLDSDMLPNRKRFGNIRNQRGLRKHGPLLKIRSL